MKKVATFLSMATIVVALSSCGSKTAENATEAVDSMATEATDMAADAAAMVDSTASAMVDSASAMVDSAAHAH